MNGSRDEDFRFVPTSRPRVGFTPCSPTLNDAPMRYLILIMLGGLALSACKEQEIRTYTAPKDPARVTPTRTPAQTPAPPAGKSQQVDWDVPEQWRQLQQEKREFRVAVFEAGSGNNHLEIVVSAFADQGGPLANINRWRRQLNLGRITDGDLVDLIDPFENKGIIGVMVDMTGPEPEGGSEPGKRLVGAIMRDAAGISWYVKALARPSVVSLHKDAIVRFAQSFRFRGDPLQLANQTGRSDEDHIKWDTPEDWLLDPAPPAFAIASFIVKEAKDTFRMTVTPLSGTGGGALANINRWRRQVGLPPVQKLDDQPAMQLDVAGSPSAILDLIGPAEPSREAKRILVALVARRQQTWFFKMVGPHSVVEGQKKAFEQFLRSVRFHSDAPSDVDSS